MKKILFYVSTLILFVSFAHAEDYVGEQLDNSQRIIFSYFDNDEWTVGLEDGSYWKIHILKSKRKQTWSEWWSSNEPEEWSLDDQFFFEPGDWKENNALTVNRTTSNIFSNCSFVLENSMTNQKAFAEFIPFHSKYIPKLTYAEPFFSYPEGGASKIAYRIGSRSSNLKNIVILEDNSCWQIYPFSNNVTSWGQWFRGEEIDQPDSNFVFQTTDWIFNDELQLYFQEGDASLAQKYEPALLKPSRSKHGIYLFENLRTKQFAYAKKLSVSELIQSFEVYAEEQKDLGYTEGYRKGKSEGARKDEPRIDIGRIINDVAAEA